MNLPPQISMLVQQVMIHIVSATIAVMGASFVAIKLMDKDISYLQGAQAATAIKLHEIDEKNGKIMEFVSEQRQANISSEKRLQRLEEHDDKRR
jgi:hypothetical protein